MNGTESKDSGLTRLGPVGRGMRIVQITPGAGDSFYCENCLRDHTQVRALRAMGHDVIMVPLYLPAYSDRPEAPGPRTPLFFGGVNVYLQQKLSLFRRTPRWLDKLLDAPRLLRWAGRKAGMTSPKDLGETTLSMLRGEHGRQGKELDRLVEWLLTQGPVDLVVLSNAMLLGLAQRIRRDLGTPVVCLLQDEQPFLDTLIEPYRSRAWALVSELAASVDALVAVSEYYGREMAGRLGIEAERIDIVHNGIELAGYAPADARPGSPVIGFLSQMCHDKGLDLLAEAFVKLKATPALADLRLVVAGGKTDADDAYLARLRRTLSRAGAAGDVEFLAGFDRRAKEEFLPGLTALAVPSRTPEASGLFALEALACGVPVVLPGHGAFVELTEATGGGLLHAPGDAAHLARTLGELLRDPARAKALGLAGRQVVADRFDIRHTTGRLAGVYENVARRPAPAAAGPVASER